MQNFKLRHHISALLLATENSIKVIEYSDLYVLQGSPNYNTLMGLAEVKVQLTELLNEIPED